VESLNKMTENLIPVQFPEVKEVDEKTDASEATLRRAFVEPEVSFPIDVLESTTYFQFVESGVSNP
jgi:hypothetical protein